MATRNLSTLRRNLLPISGFRDPASLTNLLAWYDFSDTSRMFTSNAGTGAVTSGSAVGYVTDRSGNGWHLTQATANNRPTFTGTIGGVNCLQFDGTNDSLATSSAWPLSGDATWTLFAVYNRTSATLGGLFSWGAGSFGTATLRTINTCLFQLGSGTSNTNYSLNVESTGTSYALCAQKPTGLANWIRLYRNGPVAALIGSNAGVFATSIATGAFSAGYSVNLNNYFAGQIGEFIFYNRELTTAERASVFGYLGAKWGITIT